jgi:hypothetical protein
MTNGALIKMRVGSVGWISTEVGMLSIRLFVYLLASRPCYQVGLVWSRLVGHQRGECVAQSVSGVGLLDHLGPAGVLEPGGVPGRLGEAGRLHVDRDAQRVGQEASTADDPHGVGLAGEAHRVLRDDELLDGDQLGGVVFDEIADLPSNRIGPVAPDSGDLCVEQMRGRRRLESIVVPRHVDDGDAGGTARVYSEDSHAVDSLVHGHLGFSPFAHCVPSGNSAVYSLP